VPQLAEFAAVRQGFCNSNGGHGVTYPEDLDEYEREVEKIAIPDGQSDRSVLGGKSRWRTVPPPPTRLDPERSVVIVRFRTTWDGDARACVSFEQIVPRRSV
jgi:hypothetical protein